MTFLRCVRVHGSFILFVALLFYTAPKQAFCFLLASAIHECSHIIALIHFHRPPQEIHLEVLGANIVTSSLSYTQDLICTLSGPISNIIAAFLFQRDSIFSSMNLCLGLFNLLPLPGLDGGRILLNILYTSCSPGKAERQFKRISQGMAVLCFAVALATSRVSAILWPPIVFGLLLIKTILYFPL